MGGDLERGGGRSVSKQSDAVEIVAGPIADIAAEYADEGTTTLLPPRPREVMPEGESRWMKTVEVMLKPNFWKARPYLMAPFLIVTIVFLVSVTAPGNGRPDPLHGQKVVSGNQCLVDAQLVYFPKRVDCEFQQHSRWAVHEFVLGMFRDRMGHSKKKHSKETCSIMHITEAGKEWFDRMKGYSAFDTCPTFIYTDFNHFTDTKTRLEGLDNVYVKKTSEGFNSNLDSEYSTLNSVFPSANTFLSMEGFDPSDSKLKSFSGGLSYGEKSGKVIGLMWTRVGGGEYVRSLEDEIEYVSNFGYSVYIAGGGRVVVPSSAYSAAMSAIGPATISTASLCLDTERPPPRSRWGEVGTKFVHMITQDAPWLRVDGFYFRDALMKMDYRLNMTMVALRKGSYMEERVSKEKLLCAPERGEQRTILKGNGEAVAGETPAPTPAPTKHVEGKVGDHCSCKILPPEAKLCPLPKKGAKGNVRVVEKVSDKAVWEEKGFSDPFGNYVAEPAVRR